VSSHSEKATTTEAIKPNTTPESYVIHFFGPLTVQVSAGMTGTRVMERGQQLLVTPALRQLNTDRLGNSWLDVLDDEAAQLRRWGKVMARRGPWPSESSRLVPGSAAWAEAREAARQAAHRIEDLGQRERALAQVREEFGALPTSRTLASYGR